MESTTRPRPTLKDRALLSVGAAASIMLGTIGVGAAADLAQPTVAEAYTDSGCHKVWKDRGWQLKCWRDYSWYEENCLWCYRGVDGWVYQPLL